jgi:hypothetical protein
MALSPPDYKLGVNNRFTLSKIRGGKITAAASSNHASLEFEPADG